MSAPRVGIIGAGQLARMMQPAAINLGIQLRVLATSETDSAAQVIPDVVLGHHTDIEALRAFAQGCDVVTFDHEHVPLEHLKVLQAEGINVQPNPEALQFAQDKLMMRAALTEAGIPCPRWAHISTAAELNDFALQVGWPVVLKSARGGYDGKGVWVVDNEADALNAMSDINRHGQEVLAEECVPFIQEIAAQVARTVSGHSVPYPVVKSTQTNGICHEVIAPCPDISHSRLLEAQQIAEKIATLLDVSGMLAVELFDTGERILVNELAMRPHNSGHWSMDGSVTSQFENHLRAVLNWPLGSPDVTAPYTVMVNLLGAEEKDLFTSTVAAFAEQPHVKVHLYGKDVKAGRKIGHVNVSGDNLESAKAQAWRIANLITGVNHE